jgi:hypothetical protein
VGQSNYVHLNFDKILRETDKALLIRFDDDTEEWIPLSQIADPEDYKVGYGPGEISLTEWICREKGFEG